MLPSIEGVNIAPNAHCTQSSISQWSHSPDEAQYAVNGIRTGGCSFHTDLEEKPFLLVDFGKVVDFDEIVAFNRADNELCAQRARTMAVDISIDGQGWHQVYQGTLDQGDFGSIDGNPLRIECLRYQTRFVRFQLQERNYFHLDSIEIYKR